MTTEAMIQAERALCRFVEYDCKGEPLDGKDIEGDEAIKALQQAIKARAEQQPLGKQWQDEFDAWWSKNKVATHQIKSGKGFARKAWHAAICDKHKGGAA